MTAMASDIEDIEHKGGVIECHSESPAPAWGLRHNIMLHCNIGKTCQKS
jgi:hypothetical protein